jgi:hypothetical protein
MSPTSHTSPEFHVVALQGQAEDGAGQRPAAFIHRQQFLAVQQLAAWHAVGVEDEQLDHVDIGVVCQKALGIFNGCEFHGSSLTLASRGRTDSGRGTGTDKDPLRAGSDSKKAGGSMRRRRDQASRSYPAGVRSDAVLSGAGPWGG